jgi:hypothetical protein
LKISNIGITDGQTSEVRRWDRLKVAWYT